jgi:hypothetical protein
MKKRITKYWLEIDDNDFYIGEIELEDNEDEDDAFPRFVIDWPYFLYNLNKRLSSDRFTNTEWELIELFSNYPEFKDPNMMDDHGNWYKKYFSLIIDIGFKFKSEIDNNWSYLMYKPEDDELYIGRECTLKYFGIEFKPAA